LRGTVVLFVRIKENLEKNHSSTEGKRLVCSKKKKGIARRTTSSVKVLVKAHTLIRGSRKTSHSGVGEA